MSKQGNNKDTGGFLQSFKTLILNRSSFTTLSLLGVLVIILLIWKVPEQQAKGIADPKDHATIENAARGTFVQALGGLFFLVTAYFSFQNLKVTQENLKVTQQNLVATREKQVTERFAKSIEQLGNDNIHVRLGAIYALERIAKDSDKDYWQVMEILTAYVRERSPYKAGSQEDSPPMTTDIQAVLTVIQRRTKSFRQGEENPLDLSKSNLSRVNLSHANLNLANLNLANLRNAYLSGVNLCGVVLNGANLSGAILEKAILRNAILSNADLRNADLSGADLSGANLSGANLNLANLEKANLQKAQYTDNSTSPETCKLYCGNYPCPTILSDNFDPKAAGMELLK